MCSHWVPDRERDACIICSKSFGLLRRRHHCRGCGDVFCESCSNYKLIAKANVSASHEITPVRVCAACFETFGVSEGEALYAAPKPASAAPNAATTVAAAAVATGAVAAVAATAASATSPAVAIAAKATSVTPASQTSAGAAVHPLLSFLPPALASQPLLLFGTVGGFVLLVLILATEAGAFSWAGAATLLPLLATALYLHNSVTPVVPIAPAAVVKSRASSAAFHKPSLAHVFGAGKVSNGAAMAGGVAMIGGAAMAGASLRTRASTMLPESAVSSSGTPPRAISNADRLSPGDAEIVRRSRLAHAAVISYSTDLTDWRTLKQTKPDGTGSVGIKDERAAVDWNAFVATYDQSVIVQSKMVVDPIAAAAAAAAPSSAASPATPASASASAASSPSNRKSSGPSSLSLHPVWRGLTVIPYPPEMLFRLFCDQSGQMSWNKSLVESRVMKSIAGTRTTVTYLVTAPTVGGAVASREFVNTNDWSTSQRVDDQTGRVYTDYTYAGIGLENSESTGISVPAHPRLVRGLNGPSGFVLRSIDPSPSARAQPGSLPEDRWTLFMIALDTNLSGWLPKILTDSAMPDVIVEIIQGYREAWDQLVKTNVPLPPLPPDQETGVIRKPSSP